MVSNKKGKTVGKGTAAAPRRNFLNWLWTALGLAAVVELVWLTGAFLGSARNRRKEKSPETFMEAGPVAAFAPGSVTAFPRGRFYLARLQDGGFLALSRTCPHLGCTLPWKEEEQRFVCPCHASAFDIRGEMLRAPAPRAMALHPVVIENAVVRVDTVHIVKRSRFASAQVVYSALSD
jgi:cytochrome b6-f complex iron-sulfur subunit